MRLRIDRSIPRINSYAVERTRGLYNVDAADGSEFHLDVELPEPNGEWQIGVVVGPSGSGKTSIAHELILNHQFQFPDVAWGRDMPIIEQLVVLAGSYDKATAVLASVGLASVPSWLRPHAVLSNGEAFRADVASLLLSSQTRVVVDEFTSVLDRQVARVGAAAFAKAWRKVPDRKVVLVTPHYDVLDWIQPDWYLDTAGGERLPGEERKVVSAREGDFQAPNHRSRYRGDRVGSVEC